MLKKLLKQNMGTSNLGWLQSQFHFSFAEYRNPKNVNFGVLRVLNDDLVLPQTGFDTHPHSNMEIISYVIDGEITHKDSMGNKETLCRGEVQYMSAGDGIFHSEYNEHASQTLRLMQIWILPPKNGLPRIYGSHQFKEEDRKNKLLNIVSSQSGDAPVKIHQDVNFYVSELDQDKILEFPIKKTRQIYFAPIEGEVLVNDVALKKGDALEITQEELLRITAMTQAHFLFIEMKQS